MTNQSKYYLKTVALALTASLLVIACSDRSSSEEGEQFSGNTDDQISTTEFNEIHLVMHITNNIITPTFEGFAQSAEQLKQSVEQYCMSETDLAAGNATIQDRDAHKLQAQNHWKEAVNQWQLMEVMQIGPLLENQSSLRNRIYSWPVTSSCAVDQDVVYFNQGDINGTPYDIQSRVVTRRGLDAAEYLLFSDNLAHSCTTATAPPGWNELTDNERLVMRCQFAEEVATDISNNTQTLLAAWSGENGYAHALNDAANQAGSDFENVHQAVNRISDALFYIDSVTKDAKLGIPLGHFDNSCQRNACPEDLESQFARYSLEHIRNNLVSLKLIFNGESATHQDTIGFDDFLVEQGASDTADNINNAIDNAIANIDAYQENLAEQLINATNDVEATHAQIKMITDQMKADFIEQLSLQLPASSAGDND